MMDLRQSRTACSESMSMGNPEKDWARSILFLTDILELSITTKIQVSVKGVCTRTRVCTYIYIKGEKNHMMNHFEKQDLQI